MLFRYGARRHRQFRPNSTDFLEFLDCAPLEKPGWTNIGFDDGNGHPQWRAIHTWQPDILRRRSVYEATSCRRLRHEMPLRDRGAVLSSTEPRTDDSPKSVTSPWPVILLPLPYQGSLSNSGGPLPTSLAVHH